MPDQFDNDELLNAGGKVDLRALAEALEDSPDDQDRPLSVRFLLRNDVRKRLDRYLVDRVPFLSRTSLQKLIRESAVTVNGRVPKPSTVLREGDEVIAWLPPPPAKDIPEEEMPLDVLFEDEHVIVINKQADLIVHPARGHLSGTLVNALAWHLRHRSAGGLSSVGRELARPGIVHRLDRNTTGVMIAAKTDTAHFRLGHQFEQRTTRKRYLAVVHGRVEPVADVLTFPMGKHTTVRNKYAVRYDETGKEAVTVYRVRERCEDFSLVEIELRTGRTHQIRVHMAHLGYPLVGDELYGGRVLSVGDLAGSAGVNGRSPREPIMSRQALHAALLGVRHPISGEALQWQAPWPADLRDLIELIRITRRPERFTPSGAELEI